MKSEKTFGDVDGLDNKNFPNQGHSKLVWLDKEKIDNQKGYDFFKRIRLFVK